MPRPNDNPRWWGKALALLSALLIAPFVLLAFLISGLFLAPVLVMLLPGSVAALTSKVRERTRRDRHERDGFRPAATMG